MQPKWLYRLESTDKENGLWYNDHGEFALGLSEVPNCTTKDLPMAYDERYKLAYDERYKQDGRDWHSACTHIENLLH